MTHPNPLSGHAAAQVFDWAHFLAVVSQSPLPLHAAMD
jgi:hypothetical protein